MSRNNTSNSPTLSSIDSGLSDFIQRAINDAISNALVSLPSARAHGTPNPHLNSSFANGSIPKKLKGLLHNNFKRILNTAYEIHRHRAYYKLAPLRIHTYADKLVEQYNLQAQNSQVDTKAQAIEAHLKSRSEFLETLIQRQLNLTKSLQQRSKHDQFQQACHEGLQRAITETVATRNAIWNEIFQFTSNLAIHNLHEVIRTSQTEGDQEKIDDYLRLNQLKSIYERRLKEASEHLTNGSLPKYFEAHVLKLPNSHQKTIGEVVYDTIESDWHSANAEAQRTLLIAASQMFSKQLDKARELLSQHELSNIEASQNQSAHAMIIKIKSLRSKHSASANNSPRALPKNFIQLINSSEEQINNLDQLLNLFKDESNHVEPSLFIDSIVARFQFNPNDVFTKRKIWLNRRIIEGEPEANHPAGRFKH